MSPLKQIRIGIIGAGANTKLHHIPKLAAIDGVSIVAIANRSVASAESVAKEFNVPKATDRWQELLDDPDIDAIVIGTWPYMHHPLSLAALKANKHILTEARLAMNARQAYEMQQASLGLPHLTAMVVPSPLTFEYDTTISRILKERRLGDLVYIEVKSVGGLGSPAFPQANGSPLTWRQDINTSGLNIMSLGIVYEGLQRWIGDVSSVQALSKTVVSLRTHGESGDLRAVHVPDHLNVLATHPSGANVHFLITSVLGTYTGLSFGYALYGTQGTLVLDLNAKKLTLTLRQEMGEPKVEEVKIPAKDRGSWRVEEEFIGAIRGQEPVRRTNFTQGFHYMEFAEAVTRSLQSRSAVQLPLVL